MKNTNLIYGKINTGKTAKIFNEIENLISNNENIIIYDEKEEYYKSFGKVLEDNNYNTYVINLKDSTKSNGFNPLSLPYKLYKEKNSSDAVKLVKEFCIELLKTDRQSDPFWINSASDYFSGLVLTLFKNAKEEEINLGSIVMMINQIERTDDSFKKFKEYVSNLDLLSSEYMLLSGTILAPMETRSSIVSVLKSEINKYITSENLLNLLCTNELDLTNLKDKFALLIIGDSYSNRIVNTVIDQVKYSSSKYNYKVNYIIDGIDSLISISFMNDILEFAKMREEKIIISSRNIDVLENNYGKYILDKFEEKIECNGEDSINIGDYDKYPEIKKENHNYFNIIEILK